MRVYISGPMTGIPDCNRPAFARVAEVVRAVGHEVVNPGELPPLDGGDDAPWSAYMRRDIPLLANVDAVMVLPGWEKSRGAVVEVLVANVVLGLPVFDTRDQLLCLSHGFLLARMFALFAREEWGGLIQQETAVTVPWEFEFECENDVNAVAEILQELARARRKHPKWPDDPVHEAAVLAEEAGETLQAALDIAYHSPNCRTSKQNYDRFRKEAIQAGAMAIRLLAANSAPDHCHVSQTRRA